MRRPIPALALSLAFALTACHRDPAPPPAPPPISPAQSAPAPAPVPPPPAPDPHAERCAALQARFEAVLARATGSCLANSGCACYGPVLPDSGCGNVTDSNTADQLRGIELDFRDEHCESGPRCGPWLCRAECHNGQCEARR